MVVRHYYEGQQSTRITNFWHYEREKAQRIVNCSSFMGDLSSRNNSPAVQESSASQLGSIDYIEHI